MKTADGIGLAAALMGAGSRGVVPWPDGIDKVLAVAWIGFGLAAFLYMWRWENE